MAFFPRQPSTLLVGCADDTSVMEEGEEELKSLDEGERGE